MPSEHEMKEFFQSVIDNVATLSTQASKVDGLEQRIINLSQRVDELVKQNDNLGTELYNTREQVHHLEAQVSSANQSLEIERGVTQGLRETMFQRDQRVVEVENNLTAERDSHKITISERDDARRRVNEVTEELTNTVNDLENVRSDRDRFSAKVRELEAEAHDLRQKFNQINSVINPLRAVSGDFSSVG